jgi:glycosyltransferase involved in cell wall biosynthesis
MKNLLIVAYYFPPSGGPGVQRVLKYIKYLPEYGWNPIVFTVRDADYPAIDESLLSEIPQNTTVIKSKIFEPYHFYRKLMGKSKDSPIDVNNIKKEGDKLSWKEKVIEFIRSTFFIPDARIGWFFTSKNELKQTLKQYKIDAVYSSSPPYTASLIAKNAAKILRKPWIAGFRDPWTEFIHTPKRWWLPKMIDKYLEKKVFSESDLVEVAWIGIKKDAIYKYPDLNPDKFIHIPNGFDSADYPKLQEISNDKFTLTYTGSMYGKRNPAALFDAIELLIQSNQIDLSQVHFRFIGRFGDDIHTMIQNTSFSECIEVINYLPHSKSIEMLLRSDSLLLIVDESKESEEIVPGKVYEYLGTYKPLLVIAPEQGAIADLIEETGAGLISHQSNIDKIAQNYLQLFHNWQNKIQLNSIKKDKINQYERKESARKLAELLDKLNNN